MKKFNVICAVSLNGVIGDSTINAMPWHIPLDLKNFKILTLGNTVVMGSRTFESIGKPLPGRRNVVLTRSIERAKRLMNEFGIDATYPSFIDALKNEQDGFFVIGGQHVYNEALKYVPRRLYITIVDHEFDGDVRFPIVGERFKQSSVLNLENGTRYLNEVRSSWLTENDYRFQLTIFKRDETII